MLEMNTMTWCLIEMLQAGLHSFLLNCGNVQGGHLMTDKSQNEDRDQLRLTLGGVYMKTHPLKPSWFLQPQFKSTPEKMKVSYSRLEDMV